MILSVGRVEAPHQYILYMKAPYGRGSLAHRRTWKCRVELRQSHALFTCQAHGSSTRLPCFMCWVWPADLLNVYPRVLVTADIILRRWVYHFTLCSNWSTQPQQFTTPLFSLGLATTQYILLPMQGLYYRTKTIAGLYTCTKRPVLRVAVVFSLGRISRK